AAASLILSTPVLLDRMAGRAFDARLGALAAGVTAEARSPIGDASDAMPGPAWLGRKRSELLRSVRWSRSGALDEVGPADDAGESAIRGWVFDVQRRAVPRWLLLADRDRKVIGMATGRALRPDVSAALGRPAARGAGFQGFMLGTREGVAEIDGWLAPGV